MKAFQLCRCHRENELHCEREQGGSGEAASKRNKWSTMGLMMKCSNQSQGVAFLPRQRDLRKSFRAQSSQTDAVKFCSFVCYLLGGLVIFPSPC